MLRPNTPRRWVGGDKSDPGLPVIFRGDHVSLGSDFVRLDDLLRTGRVRLVALDPVTDAQRALARGLKVAVLLVAVVTETVGEPEQMGWFLDLYDWAEVWVAVCSGRPVDWESVLAGDRWSGDWEDDDDAEEAPGGAEGPGLGGPAAPGESADVPRREEPDRRPGRGGRPGPDRRAEAGGRLSGREAPPALRAA